MPDVTDLAELHADVNRAPPPCSRSSMTMSRRMGSSPRSTRSPRNCQKATPTACFTGPAPAIAGAARDLAVPLYREALARGGLTARTAVVR